MKDKKHSQCDFGINFLDHTNIWQSCLNRIFKDLNLNVEAKVEKYIDDRDHIPVKDRINISVTEV